MTLRSGSYSLGDFKSARDWHIYHVYSDPDFIKEIDRLDPAADRDKEYQKIAKSFDISIQDVFWFDMSRILYTENNVARKGIITPDFKNKKMTLTFDFSMTKTELLEIWGDFETMRKGLAGVVKSKRKPPEYPKLIYAIFKARKAGHTFKEIYGMYSRNELPQYSGATTRLQSEDDLERYYDKYKPGV